MINFKVSKEAQKGLDKLISTFHKERGKKLDFLFESILDRLKVEKKLDFILDK